jgi:hypothetical protein
VKLLPQDNELYVLAQSRMRIHKERGMWQRKLRALVKRLKEKEDATFSFSLNRSKLREVRRREGRYLLRTNLCDRKPAQG